MNDDRLTLIKKGCLGTCWHGRYHYVEPWAGCQFDCAYCYARFRSPVRDKLSQLGTAFDSPLPLYSEDQLINEIRQGIRENSVEIAKLSRYTDIFLPIFQKNHLAHQILEILAESPVRRIIITTKGVPDDKAITLMSRYKEKFSYNFVAKPEGKVQLEDGIPPLEDRLGAGARLNDAGVQVTVHMDPMVPGIEDGEDILEQFLTRLGKFRLRRVMFSYLLLNSSIIEIIRNRFGDDFTGELLEYFEETPHQMLPGQEETDYRAYLPHLRRESIQRISGLLNRGGFDFVLCSLKSGRGNLKLTGTGCTSCDGNFYA